MTRLRTNAAVGIMAATLVGGFEGDRRTAYQDVVGVWTVCSGHTVGVKRGDHYSLAQCRQILISDMDIYANGVEKCTKVQIPDQPYIAFVSFAFNLGVGRYCQAIAPLVNSGHMEAACDKLLNYDKARRLGILVTYPGLTRRREEESSLCHQGHNIS